MDSIKSVIFIPILIWSCKESLNHIVIYDLYIILKCTGLSKWKIVYIYLLTVKYHVYMTTLWINDDIALSKLLQVKLNLMSVIRMILWLKQETNVIVFIFNFLKPCFYTHVFNIICTFVSEWKWWFITWPISWLIFTRSG